jgi:hypothetical protein
VPRIDPGLVVGDEDHGEGIPRVVCEEKHMGSRAVVLGVVFAVILMLMQIGFRAALSWSSRETA